MLTRVIKQESKFVHGRASDCLFWNVIVAWQRVAYRLIADSAPTLPIRAAIQ